LSDPIFVWIRISAERPKTSQSVFQDLELRFLHITRCAYPCKEQNMLSFIGSPSLYSGPQNRDAIRPLYSPDRSCYLLRTCVTVARQSILHNKGHAFRTWPIRWLLLPAPMPFMDQIQHKDSCRQVLHTPEPTSSPLASIGSIFTFAS
jgi:hypothetical protein